MQQAFIFSNTSLRGSGAEEDTSRAPTKVTESSWKPFSFHATSPQASGIKEEGATNDSGRVENQEFTAQKSGLVVKICRNTCCKENLRWFRVFERLLPVLGAAARRAYCPGRRFQETASTDRQVFSRTSTAIELKLRIKRFWPQGRAKRRKWGSGTDTS